MNPINMIALGVLVGIKASFTGLGGGFIMVSLMIVMGFSLQLSFIPRFFPCLKSVNNLKLLVKRGHYLLGGMSPT